MMRFTKYKVELIKESASNYGGQDFNVNSAKQLYKAMCDLYHVDKQAEETLLIVCVDIKLKIIGVHEVSRGTIDASLVHQREIFKRAILNNAAKIFVVHNHPSGIAKPSNADFAVTRKIKDAGELLDISLLDHIIIGDGEYYSFRENNEL
jgi:DNA repair protein RadC